MLRCHVALWALPSKDCCRLLSPETKPGLTKTPFCFFESKEDRLVAMMCFQCVFFLPLFCVFVLVLPICFSPVSRFFTCFSVVSTHLQSFFQFFFSLVTIF